MKILFKLREGQYVLLRPTIGRYVRIGKVIDPYLSSGFFNGVQQ